MPAHDEKFHGLAKNIFKPPRANPVSLPLFIRLRIETGVL